MSKNININTNTNIAMADAAIIREIEELMGKNANVRLNTVEYLCQDKYVDANGETVYMWKSREYRLSDLKSKAIPEFNVDEVAHYMLLEWATILHDLHTADLDDIKYAINNARTYFIESIQDSVVWEAAAADALVTVTDNVAFREWENYYEMFGSDHKELQRYYKYVYNKLANRLNDLSEKYVLMFARNRLYTLLIEARNAAM